MSVALTFLTRTGCHLCEDARARVAEAIAGRDVVVEEIDIDTDPQLQAEYDWDVPVVLLGGRKHSFHRVDTARLAAAIDRLAARGA
ncbi:glutaredoxin family protein [Brevibacterium samyangense]